MKKLFQLSNNQNGFLFPIVVFMTAVLLLVTISSISIYKNHLELTQMETEQIKLDSLVQMAKTQIKTEIEKNGLPEETKKIDYLYPNGNVSITWKTNQPLLSTYELVARTDQGYNAHMTIQMKTN